MFDHVTIRASERAASERFYRTVLSTLGREPVGREFIEWDEFSVAQARDGRPVTRGLHVGFAAPSRAVVDAFWRAGVRAGHPSDGEPGPRPQYSESYYGAFLLDPDGNSIEAVHHDSVGTRSGAIDHLWIRVSDLAASRRFYEQVSAFAAFELRRDLEERAGFGADGGSFGLVEGTPTQHAHLAFAAEQEQVDAFHEALTGAGYRDNGTPGERPAYHAGYYGAFVLDPDGNNVELVDHHR